MHVNFTPEKMMQLDTIKTMIKNDPQQYGFEELPDSVDDNFALEYAITFTAQLLFYRRFPELLVDESS